MSSEKHGNLWGRVSIRESNVEGRMTITPLSRLMIVVKNQMHLFFFFFFM